MGRGERIKNEVHFFDRNDRPLEWYMDRFKDGYINGEKTPAIIARPDAIARMAAQCPHVQIIVLLRDPVKRLLSAHKHLGRGRTLQSFLRMPVGIDAVYRGRYAEQLQQLFERYPREQVLIEFNEELRQSPEAPLARIAAHIGLSAPLTPWPAPRDRRVPPQIREKFGQYYRPYNEQLTELLDKELPWS